MKSAYLVIAHGSRSKESEQAFEEFLQKLKKASPKRFIQGAYLEISEPQVSEGIDLCVEAGAREIFVIPLMFFPGRHVRDDIPALIKEAYEKYPYLTFHYSGPLCEDPALLEIINKKVSK